LGPRFGTPIWDHKFGTPIWDPYLGGDMGPPFWTLVWGLTPPPSKKTREHVCLGGYMGP
jgi:hypothetical protein